jgi:hypothetical protein
MPAKIREMLIGFGFAKQAAIATANTVAGIWRLGKLNTSFTGPKLITESDAAELGKGHEFATQLFKASWDVKGSIEKYLSSDFAAWVMAFGLGHVTYGGSAGLRVYTCTPLVPVTDGLELPYFSFVEQIRPGVLSVIDRMVIGCAIDDWTLTFASGPGRASTKLVANIVGCGKYVKPSGITLPPATVEKLLPSASLALTVNGVDYVGAKNIVQGEATWKNNLVVGFFPGSGMQGAMAQVETITLTGTSGTANVGAAGSLTKVATYGDSLTDTAGDFVTSHTAAYTAVGITVTSSGPTLIFTATVPGTPFTAPTITNVTGNLAGTVVHTTPNCIAGESGAIAGRLEVGDREGSLNLTVRFEHGSEELNKVISQAEGTAVILLTYDENNSLLMTYERVTFAVVEPGETDGIVTVQITTAPLWHASNGLLTVVAKCNTNGIAQPE